MSDLQNGSRYPDIEVRVAVWASHVFTSKPVLKELARSFKRKDRPRFNTEAQRFFDEVLERNCPLGHFPPELQEAPYEDGLAMFQRSLWKVVGTIVEGNGSLSPKVKLALKYGREPFGRTPSAARPSGAFVVPDSVLISA